MEPFCVRRIRAKNIQQPQQQWKMQFLNLVFGFISSHIFGLVSSEGNKAGNMLRIRSLANFQHCWGVCDRNVDGFTAINQYPSTHGTSWLPMVVQIEMVYGIKVRFLVLHPGFTLIWTQLPARCIQFNHLTLAVQQSNHPQCRFHDQGDPEEW